MRSMKAVSLRISGGRGPNRWPMRCWCCTSTSKLPTMTMPPYGPDAFLAPAELAGLHVALHDVDAVLLVEGDAGDLVEADHIVLADQSALAVGIVDEHAGDGRLAAGDQMGIGRDLLEEVALAGAARAKLDQCCSCVSTNGTMRSSITSRARSPRADPAQGRRCEAGSLSIRR